MANSGKCSRDGWPIFPDNMDALRSARVAELRQEFENTKKTLRNCGESTHRRLGAAGQNNLIQRREFMLKRKQELLAEAHRLFFEASDRDGVETHMQGCESIGGAGSTGIQLSLDDVHKMCVASAAVALARQSPPQPAIADIDSQLADRALANWMDQHEDELPDIAAETYMEKHEDEVSTLAAAKFLEENEDDLQDKAVEQYMEEHLEDVKDAAVEEWRGKNDEELHGLAVAKYLEDNEDHVHKAAVEQWTDMHDHEIEDIAIAAYIKDNEQDVKDGAIREWAKKHKEDLQALAVAQYIKGLDAAVIRAVRRELKKRRLT